MFKILEHLLLYGNTCNIFLIYQQMIHTKSYFTRMVSVSVSSSSQIADIVEISIGPNEKNKCVSGKQ